jgi:hypothetical protein
VCSDVVAPARCAHRGRPRTSRGRRWPCPPVSENVLSRTWGNLGKDIVSALRKNRRRPRIPPPGPSPSAWATASLNNFSSRRPQKMPRKRAPYAFANGNAARRMRRFSASRRSSMRSACLIYGCSSPHTRRCRCREQPNEHATRGARFRTDVQQTMRLRRKDDATRSKNHEEDATGGRRSRTDAQKTMQPDLKVIKTMQLEARDPREIVRDAAPSCILLYAVASSSVHR